MNTWFAAPWGLLALLALPALYWLHRHVIEARRRDVSNLSLWADREHVKREGRVRRRITDRVVLALEAASLLALALVIAGFEPRPGRPVRPRIALVIDASASMSGGSRGRRPIDAVRQRLAAIARGHPELRVSLVLAGPEPALLGDVDLDAARADALLARLEPHAASSRLGPALDLARSLDLHDDNLLVFSDDPALAHPRLVRVGEAEPNLAIVRASWATGEAPFLVLRRFGAGPSAVALRVRLDGGSETQQSVSLNANGEAPLALRVDATVQRVDIQLPGDVMQLDDHATLFRPPLREIRVDASGTPAPLQAAVRHAAAAIPALRPASGTAIDLRITGAAPLAGATSSLVFASGPTGTSHPALGLQADPFSPLMAAFEPRGLVWYAWPLSPPNGAQILLRGGDQALIWRTAGAITLDVDLERSNLLGHIAFPLFLDALVQELDRARGGLARRNFALGESLRFLPDARSRGDVHVQLPSGERVTFPPGAPIDLGSLREQGVYELRSGEQVEPFAVQLQSAAESNLPARSASATPPRLSMHETKAAEPRPFAPSLLFLAALACACVAFTRLERRATSP